MLFIPFQINIQASTRKEGYMMFRKLRINELFKNEDSFTNDLLEYADIALDLEVYSFATHLYWLIITSVNMNKQLLVLKVLISTKLITLSNISN